MKNWVYMCAHCGSFKVQLEVWQDMNRDTICGDAGEKAYCVRCNGHAYATLLTRYQGNLWVETYGAHHKRDPMPLCALVRLLREGKYKP